MSFRSRVRAAWLFSIKHSINRLNLWQARRGRLDFVIMRTTGRRTGKTFETPIIAQKVADGFVIELTYGPQVNWYQNLVAAHGGELVRGDTTWKIGPPVEISTAEGMAAFTRGRRIVLKLLRRTHFRKLPLA